MFSPKVMTQEAFLCAALLPLRLHLSGMMFVAFWCCWPLFLEKFLGYDGLTLYQPL